MKYLIFPLVALGLGTAAMAQPAPSAPKSYPPCSKSVTDECMGSSHATMHHTAMHHTAMRSHRKMATHHHKSAARHHKMAAHHAMKAKPAPKPA
ncbi:hypothetical protein [Sphingobium estronivorans]|uniref:hypothetical protein n=1 Tax=Sphingobium estronivorans TaxID=1577690 RepID=UPI0012386BE2|nr:hypothetical protein [Sphingobium estronivorans]